MNLSRHQNCKNEQLNKTRENRVLKVKNSHVQLE